MSQTLHGLRCRCADIPLILDVWKQEIYEKIARVQRGDIVVDAGAHIGSFTVKVAGSAGKVIAFEPEPENFKLLLRNTARLQNVEAHQRALWSENCQATLYHNRSHTGASSLIPLPPGVCDYELEVEAVRLDDVVDSVDFLKMDVEGCELEVLKGAQNVIRSCSPVIVFEAHPISPLEKWWSKIRELLSDYTFKGLPSEIWMSSIVTALPRS